MSLKGEIENAELEIEALKRKAGDYRKLTSDLDAKIAKINQANKKLSALEDNYRLNLKVYEGTKFKYEILHPDYHHLLRRVEFHAIRAFASFFKNKGKIQAFPVSKYTLVNKNWPRRH